MEMYKNDLFCVYVQWWFFLRQSFFSTWPKIEVSGRKIICGFANTEKRNGHQKQTNS